ncbi:MAG: Mur ligase domain-containing protein, partial [Phycisphaeraceae bacterium]|nr:Mur ligase domain-containing protein [Phycisphaeraceae bacterium]
MQDTEVAPPVLRGRRVHFVGIGGCGMSGLARIVAARGAHCTGTDRVSSIFTQQLQAENIPVAFEQTAESVPDPIDLMVISAAVDDDHPEVAEARRRGVEVLKYAQMLGRLMIGRTGVAIAGTHGKSTTTAMLAHTLIHCDLDPTFVVGAQCDQIGGGARVGRADMLIAEACEFDRSFHNFHPTHSVILNVEEDHLDIYGSLDGVLEAFCKFAERTPEHGTLLIGHEGACRTPVAAGVHCPVETIGYAPQADWVIDTQQTLGAQHVTIRQGDRLVVQFDGRLPGEHMAYNAAVAAVTAHRLGGDWQAIGEALSSFAGLDRRMQPMGQVCGVTVVDD